MDEQKEASSKSKKFKLSEFLRSVLIGGLVGGLVGNTLLLSYYYLSEEKWLVLVSFFGLFLISLMAIIRLREKE